MTARLTVLGVPSSAGAYAPGQELAPTALREHGLLRKLETVGWQVNDLGDLPVWRWRPDRNRRRQQNLDTVVGYVKSSAAAIAEHAQVDDVVLVLGGDCTVGLGSLLAQPSPESIALVYFDMHSDLNVPDSTIDGALDWMGMAHALGNETATPELSRLGRRFPLLEPKQLVFLGFEPSQATSWELECIDRNRLETITAAQVIADPVDAAEAALRQFEAHEGPLLVHFDVDVIDFVDAPLSENPGRNVGITLDIAVRVLSRLCADPHFRALTITELNPLHGAEDGTTLSRFVDGVVGALKPRR